MILYNLKSEGDGYRISKFNDLELESSYHLDPAGCECPQWVGRQRECRHMKMLPLMEDRANTAWFFCFEEGTWHDPLGAATPEEPFEADAQGEAYAGEGPGPSTLAAKIKASPSQVGNADKPVLRGEPAPLKRRF